MNFEIKEDGKNIRVFLKNENEEIASATCYFEDTPIYNEKNSLSQFSDRMHISPDEMHLGSNKSKKSQPS